MYETVENIRKRLPRITEDIRTDEFIESCILEAQSEIDGRIGVRYSVPLTEPIDPIITYITSSIAQSLVLESVYASDTPFIGDLVASLRERASVLLGMIAEGKITIIGGSHKKSPGVSTRRDGLSVTTSDESEFYAPDEALRRGRR